MFQKKHQNWRWKKWVCTGLAVAMTLGMTACNGSKGSDTTGAQKEGKASVEELAPEYTYVAEYLTLPADMEAYNLAFGKDAAYGMKYNYDEATGASGYSIMKYAFSGGTFQEGESVLSFPENISIQNLSVDAEGNLYFIEMLRPEGPGEDATDEDWDNYYQNMNSSSDYHLVKLDAQGNQVYDEDFSDKVSGDGYFYPQYLLADSQGRIYLYVNNGDANAIKLFDEGGKYQGEIPADQQNWISAMGTAKDGKVYAAYTQYNNDSVTGVISELDYEGKKFGSSYKNFPANGQIIPGMEGDVICSDSNALYEYSFEKEEATKLLTWIDCDIEGNKVSNVFATAEGQLFAILNDWSNGTNELAMFKKVKTEDVVKRERITIGSIYQNSTLASQIVEFNKNNENYRVTMKTYMDENNWSDKSYEDAITNLTNDILSGNCPDILDLSGLDIQNFADKGVLEDLMPYLEKSTNLKKEDFFERILDAGTFNGKLIYITSGFALETLAAKTSLVGDKMGWTVSDVIRLKEQHPNAELIEYATKDDILRIMLMMNKSYFIDPSTGACHFDSQEFKDVLAFANTFPKEVDYTQPHGLTPHLLADDRLLLSMTGLSDFESVQSALAYFDGEDVTFIGFPSFDNSNGCLLNPTEQYGMSAQAANKEAAWSFLESIILSRGSESDYYYYGFSSIKSKYEEQKAKALDVKYVYDENGEILLDDKGNPIVEGHGGGWTMVGDDGEEWTYEYRPITKEEVDMVDTLLAGAKAIDLSLSNELNEIISEEAEYYFSGSKSLDEVAGVIQNRVNLYVQENR